MNRDTSLTRDFTSGNIPRQLMEFALPLYLSNILQIVYQIADMAIVGQAMGKVGLSAVSVGGDVSNFMTFFAMGFSNAGQVILAQYVGAKRQKEIGPLVGNMLGFIVIGALFLSTILLSIQERVLTLMNTPSESWDGALAYSAVCMSGLVFVYGYNMMGAILRGLGDSRHPFLFVSASAIANVILDLVLVMGFSLGARGAAIATVMSQALSFFCCAVFLHRNQHRLGFSLHSRDFWQWDANRIGKLAKLGLPMAIKGASIQTSKLFVNSWINSYGVAVSAFAGVANKLGAMANLLSNAMNTAGSSMVGQNLGAGKFRRVTRIMQVIFVVGLSIASVLSLILWFWPEAVYGIFTDETEVLLIGMAYRPIGVLIFFGSACRSPMNALIDGSGNATMNFCTALFDGILLRIGLSVLFGLWLGMGYQGFWLGDALAGFTPLWLGAAFYWSGRWKKKIV